MPTMTKLLSLLNGSIVRLLEAVNSKPQNLDGSVNEEEYRRHISWLANNGIRFIHLAAATGQSMRNP